MVKTFISNNGSYGTIRMHQEMAYKRRVHGTELRNPDFAKWAESFGARGLSLASIEAAESVVAQALAHDGPVVVDVKTARRAHQLRSPRSPRCGGETERTACQG